MLPTFVIGLREGLEAALIVGIIAAFLRKQGRRDLLRWVFFGVGTAIALCLAAGIALDVLSKDLPQKQQEGLETVIGALAVGMVTYMVVWMKRNSRGLKGQLEGLTADAMNDSGGGTLSGGARAMVAMAFLAVLREGVETVVFLLAAFNQSESGASAPIGAALGIVVAVALGYGIYRGGVRINLSKFFRATGLVLVLVAAGLVVNALRTAHEAGWINVGQGGTVDLTWLVTPGSVLASLLTGMLGLQTRPVVIEVIGWLVYLVPVGVYVAWPPGRSLARRTVSRALLAAGAVLAVAAAVLAISAPDRPGTRAVTTYGNFAIRATVNGDAAKVVSESEALSGTLTYQLTRQGSAERSGVLTGVFTTRTVGTGGDRPTRLGYGRLAELNGGNLPIGIRATPGGTARVTYRDTVTTTAWIETRTARVIDLRSREVVTATIVDPTRGSVPLSRPVQDATTALPAAVASAAGSAARTDADTFDRAALLAGLAWTAGVLALVLLLAGAGLAFSPRARQPRIVDPALDGQLVKS